MVFFETTGWMLQSMLNAFQIYRDAGTHLDTFHSLQGITLQIRMIVITDIVSYTLLYIVRYYYIYIYI